MNKPALFFICCLCVACHSRKKPSDEAFFPVSNFLKGEVTQAANSGATIQKIESDNGVSDTAQISQATFRKDAEPFTNLPDINSDDWKSDYEETKMFDEQLQTVILTYTAKKDDAPVRKEDVMLVPNEKGDTHVKTIIIDWLKDERDSTVEKNMIWEAGKGFFIVTKVNKTGQPEKIKKLEVNWNRLTNQSTSRSTEK